MAFGLEVKQKEFLLDDDTTFLNHGSYGTAPKTVFEHRIKLLREQEGNPNVWFGSKANNYYLENIKAVAKFVRAKEENVVFADNTTSGINHVIKSLKFEAGDVILVNSFTYIAIQLTCKSAAERCGATVQMIDIAEHSLSADKVVARYDEYLTNNSKVKLAVIDYISSASATVFPVVELIKVCKKHNVMVVVDGAHTPGQVALNLEELGQLGMDFFAGNLHKWAYSCRGCAVLWVHPAHHDVVRHLVTSFQYIYPESDFRSYFFYNGTNDRTNFFTAKEGINFIERYGGLDNIVKYNAGLLDEAVEYLVKLWGTKKHPMSKDMEAPCMRLVRVPDLKKFPLPPNASSDAFCDLGSLNLVLRGSRFNLATVVLVINKEPWVRLSANIYNVIEDYHKLRNAICELLKEDN